MADDAGGDVLVGHLPPGGDELGFAEAGAVEFQGQFAQLLAGEVAGRVSTVNKAGRVLEWLLMKSAKALM